MLVLVRFPRGARGAAEILPDILFQRAVDLAARHRRRVLSESYAI